LVNGTFADDVRDIGAIQKRSVSLRLSLKDLMFFVNELPNLVDLMKDYETNSMQYAREELLQAWKDSHDCVMSVQEFRSCIRAISTDSWILCAVTVT